MSKPKKQNKKEIVKKYSKEEAKGAILEMAKVAGDINHTLKELGEDILPKFMHGNKNESKAVQEKLDEKAREVLFALEGQTHVALMESFNPSYRGLVKNLSDQIIQEYDCKTNLEKSLVEVIVNSYIRTIDNARRFNNCAEAGEYITENRTKYLAMLSKQMDRANRQFLSSLMTLKQIKAPEIRMNIKTTNAFVSKNQQFNSRKENNESK